MIALLLALVLLQSPAAHGVVVDQTGAPIAGASVTMTAGTTVVNATTAEDGTWSAATAASDTPVSVRISAPGFAPVERPLAAPVQELRTELRPEAIAEHITVSAETSPARLAIESSVTTIDRTTLAEAPALRLDDQLRTVPGFSLFRRTSSAVANPTTQGVTLRGLSASGASRTLGAADARCRVARSSRGGREPYPGRRRRRAAERSVRRVGLLGPHSCRRIAARR